MPFRPSFFSENDRWEDRRKPALLDDGDDIGGGEGGSPTGDGSDSDSSYDGGWPSASLTAMEQTGRTSDVGRWMDGETTDRPQHGQLSTLIGFRLDGRIAY
jgi:hypothetical protein